LCLVDSTDPRSTNVLVEKEGNGGEEKRRKRKNLERVVWAVNLNLKLNLMRVSASSPGANTLGARMVCAVVETGDGNIRGEEMFSPGRYEKIKIRRWDPLRHQYINRIE
jgi:hypothetical protein